jgi:hypothetical protein
LPPTTSSTGSTLAGRLQVGKSKKATKAPADAFERHCLISLPLWAVTSLLKSRYDFSASVEKRRQHRSRRATVTDAQLKEALKKLRMKTNPEKWGIAKVVIEEPMGDPARSCSRPTSATRRSTPTR